MKNIAGEKKFCFLCMQEHLVDVVELVECTEYKGVEVYYTARYEYCHNADEYVENESMIKANRAAIKEAYQYSLSSNSEN